MQQMVSLRYNFITKRFDKEMDIGSHWKMMSKEEYDLLNKMIEKENKVDRCKK
jgi:hypothetical protein